MPRASETHIKKRAKDGALTCSAQHGRGRCGKLLVTTDGQLLCKNGHTVTIGEAWNAYLAESAWSRETVGHIWPYQETIKAIIARVATPEFLQADRSEWQGLMIRDLPFLSWLVLRAREVDRKAAATLEEFWAKRICAEFPLLDRYLRSLKRNDLLQVRERIFRSLSNWTVLALQPEGHITLWEIHLEAATNLRDPFVALYQHNLSEALRCLQDGGGYVPLYFLRCHASGDFRFILLPSPLYQHSSLQREQVTFIYEVRCGALRWNVDWDDSDGNGPDPVGRCIQTRLNAWRRSSRADGKDGWSFYADYNYIHVHPPAAGYPRTPQEVLAMMQALRSQLDPIDLDTCLHEGVAA